MKRWPALIQNLLPRDQSRGERESIHATEPLAEARRLVERKQMARAFTLLNQIKAQRVPVRGADYLRALYFLDARQPAAAREAVKEELRYFPDSDEAKGLLKQLTTEESPRTSHHEPELRELLDVIQPYTMVGEARLGSLYRLAREACAEDLPGNFVECGVAAGGSSALLAAVIARHSRRPRRLFSFDTFTGMPDASAHDTHAGQNAGATGWGSGTCAAPETSLCEVCAKLGVENLVEPVKGLFADTLPANRVRIGPIALLHMDGDWYTSTRDILANLFDQVVSGGRIQIDDYGFWDGCRRAVTEFEQQRGLKFSLQRIDETGVWLAK